MLLMKPVKKMKSLGKEWFEKFSGMRHVYRDNCKYPYVNLIKVEILKRK